MIVVYGESSRPLHPVCDRKDGLSAIANAETLLGVTRHSLARPRPKVSIVSSNTVDADAIPLTACPGQYSVRKGTQLISSSTACSSNYQNEEIHSKDGWSQENPTLSKELAPAQPNRDMPVPLKVSIQVSLETKEKREECSLVKGDLERKTIHHPKKRKGRRINGDEKKEGEVAVDVSEEQKTAKYFSQNMSDWGSEDVSRFVCALGLCDIHQVFFFFHLKLF